MATKTQSPVTPLAPRRRATPRWADAQATDIRLSLPAEAGNVPVARHAVGGLAGPLGLPEELVHRVRLAVTEACTNVVRHAYADGDDARVLELRVRTIREGLQVEVRDGGSGIAPHASSASLGLGLPLMASVSDSLRIFRDRDGTNVVAMWFRGRDEEPEAG